MSNHEAKKYIGRKLDGRYQVNELIGVGGMSYVYKATDLKDGSTVAVKILKEEFAAVNDLVRRFRNESKAIRMLDHENIVKVLDVNFSDSVQFIVMEYLDGITLKKYIEKNGALTWKQTVYFAEQLLKALQHAHDRGIIHRDMKPQNVMISEGGILKVMDFGIARFSRSSLHTITDKAIGTVHYISPEQAQGDDTDSRADIYSVGVMMYEMCTGRLPFDGDSAVSVALKQISDQAEKIERINPDVPEGLQRIIERAMEKDPNSRYQSAGAMLTELEHFRKNPGSNFDYKSSEPDATEYINRVAKKRTAASAVNTDRKESNMARKDRPKKEKPLRPRTIGFGLGLIMGLTFVCLVGSLVMAYMTLKNAGSSLFTTPEEVALPDFVGESLRDVQADPSYSKFRFTVEEEYNPDAPVGMITAQTPKPPKTVKDNARITLYVSKGVEIVTIPAVVGDTYGAATNALQDLGLIVYRELDQSDKYESNIVTRTDPEVGTSVESGSIVKIYVNSPATYVSTSVPSVIGMKASDAISTLMSNGLTKGTITLVRGVQAGNESIQPGCVVSQSIRGGTRVEMMTAVNLVIREALAEKEWNFRFDAPFSDANGNEVMTATFHKDGAGAVTYTVGGVTMQSGINLHAKGAEETEFLIKLNGIDYRRVKLDFQLGTSTVIADYSRSNGFSFTEPEKYRVATRTSEGGSLSVSSSEAYAGRNVEVYITPSPGWRLSGLTDNSRDVTGFVSDGVYTISNINENHTVSATFTQLEYHVSVNVVNGSGNSECTAYYGETVSFQVSPSDGYEYDYIEGDGSYSDGTVTVYVTGDTSITVAFKEIIIIPDDPDPGNTEEPDPGSTEDPDGGNT